MDYFWEIGVNPSRHEAGGHKVYYHTTKDLTPDVVAVNACKDKLLITTFVDFVEYAIEITAEEYFEYMSE